jgi:hypothetical protein
LALWEGIVTWHSGMVTSAGGEATLWREKRGDDAVGLTRFLLGKKIKKNPSGRFSSYKWNVKI